MLESMMRFLRTRFFAIGIAFALGLCALISCQPPASTNDTGMASPPAGIRNDSHTNDGHARDGAVRDLSRDEAAGGHILRKHVGQTDDELRQRLEREHRITGASTFTDRSTAEHAVGETIAHSRDRIDHWMGRPGGHPNLVLDYDSPIPVGRTLNRGESQPHPCSHVLVVLKYSEPNDYYVLTSYPECRQ
jgi:Bacterial CdiA-CT RNAse A domain